MKPISIGYFIVLAATACQSSANQTVSPPPATAPGGQQSQTTAPAADLASDGTSALTVTQVLSQQPGSAVRVSGLYFGWKGPCRGQPPTRSAWQLVESTDPAAACIYVDGPSVPGISPNAPAPNVVVVVQGKYKVDRDMRYIEADRIEKK